MTTSERHAFEIPLDLAGLRFDQALARLLPDYSRSRLQAWIKAGNATLDGRVVETKARVHAGQRALVLVESRAEHAFLPEPVPLDVRYEDRHLLVIDKQAGIVVHPGAGNPDGTLANALLHLDPGLASVPRAGIVHRLDKHTSGLMVIARSLPAHHRLVMALKHRAIHRGYEAVVRGVLTGGGQVDAPIGRHPTQRQRMAVSERGKPARTRYRVVQRFRSHTHVRLELESGRTHQIRVHMAHIGHPLVGDPTYAGRTSRPAGFSEDAWRPIGSFPRQALHASRLRLVHPMSAEELSFTSELPADIAGLLSALAREPQP
jgi:23S rRNA pseudouridine1911/1915/1917 synthase